MSGGTKGRKYIPEKQQMISYPLNSTLKSGMQIEKENNNPELLTENLLKNKTSHLPEIWRELRKHESQPNPRQPIKKITV